LQPVFNNQNLFIKFIGFVLDISERKEAERALKLSEEKFAKAFDNSPNAITISSIEDSTLIDINEYGLRALGYDKTEVIGKTALDLGIITADERKIILDAIEKDGFYKNLELPIKTKSGEIRIGAHFGQPIKIGDNNYLFQTINDITDRKRAEEELKYSEEKYLKTFLSSPDSISLTSMKEGILVEINNGFEKIFGYSRDAALGKTTIELGVWQDINDRDNCIKILKEQGLVRNYIADYSAKDGRSGTGEISMELVLIRDEEYLLTIVRDITERIQIERELKASEEKFSTAFYASPDANAISRMKDGKIIDINPVFEKLFEYSREEVIGNTTAELNIYINPMDRKKVFDLLNKDGVVRNLTIEYKAKSGKVGFTQLSIDQIHIADELCLITIIRDITGQIKTQREIEDYQKKLKSLTSEITLAEERERRRIAINLHDHLSQSLAMSKIRLAEAEKQRSEEEIYKKIRDAKNFLDNAITKSRSITYELSPPVLYDLGFSAAIRWQLDELAKEHKIKTELKDIADKIKLNDEVRVLLFRAVVEIINNALKHAMASKLMINISNDEDQLFVEVTDNGKGFDLIEAEQNAVRNRSFGIFSIRERISFLNGTMEIDSQLNKGTAVKISIPYKDLDK
jgi:PAS domain S-box-containing protein